MSTGSAPVRGALFECAVVLLGAGVMLGARSVSPSNPDAPFRLLWLSDLGAESSASERATSRDENELVLARVPGAVYALAIDHGGARKLRRLSADYSMVYGLASSPDGDLVLAGDDGAIRLWSRSGGDLVLRWQKELDERPVSIGWDGGEDVWVATRRSQLMALSAANGEPRWSVSLGSRADAPPVRSGDALFVATKGQTLVRLDAVSGKAKWTTELPGPANHSPIPLATDAVAVLASTWNGHLVAVDGAGETLWSVELPDRLAGAPLVAEGLVAVPTEDGAVRGFDLEGKPLWTREDIAGERTDLLPRTVTGEPARLVAVSHRLAVIDAANGEIVNDYPEGAVADLEQRFLDVMLEGERPYSETEKVSLLERESFPIRGRLFGRAERVRDSLVFGTEDGWIYWFDWASLRPVCRYRAGQRANDSAPVWAHGALVVSASESVFGIDPDSGDTLWQREVGPVTQLVASEALAVVGEDRLDVFDPATGARQWSARGAYQAVAAVEDGWLAFDRAGTIGMLDSAGTPGGASLAPLSSIDAVAPLGEGLWAVASADGEVAVIAWDAAPREIWQIDLDPPIASLSRAQETLVVSLTDRLVGLSTVDGSLAWEIPVGEGETPLLDQHLFIATGEALRVYEPVGGTLVVELPVGDEVVGATLYDGAVVWMDASGTAHRAPLAAAAEAAEEAAEAEAEGRESVPLGGPLSRATFTNGRVLVTTAAGEIGLIELTPGGPAAPSPNDFPQEEKK